MLKIKVRKNIYLFLQNLNTNLKYKFSLAERPLSNTQYLPLGARLYSACWVTELKVDYILVWSQSNLLFSIRQIFYQKMQFCRLTCDTNLENFLKGFRFIFSTNLIFRKICENSACYRVSHGKVSFRDLELGGVHKLRLQDLAFFDHLPPSSCKRSLWTPPCLDCHWSNICFKKNCHIGFK